MRLPDDIREEGHNMRACISEAKKNGFSVTEAVTCEDRSRKCVNCPFRGEGLNGSGSRVSS